ncbi:MAG: HIT family protein [Chloroflexi bacterium]|nr:HIT family protein [Chloroflexota bacterium]
MPAQSKTWMPREQWDALVRGEDCPLCAAVTTQEDVNEYGYTIADLEISRFRLVMNQFVPGYCVLICQKHVREPYELVPADQAAFFQDMMRAGLALEKVYRPVKMNFQILGNAVPHLHCHLVPRYYGDPAPAMPLDPGLETRLLAPEAYLDQVARIRQIL